MDIQISVEELKNHARIMKGCIDEMRTALDTASSVMSRTGESFASSAGDAFRGQYNQLRGRFESFYSEMSSYVTFLIKTAATYERTDADIANAARDMVK